MDRYIAYTIVTIAITAAGLMPESWISALFLVVAFVNLAITPAEVETDIVDFDLRLEKMEARVAEVDEAAVEAVRLAAEASDRAGEAILSGGIRAAGSR